MANKKAGGTSKGSAPANKAAVNSSRASTAGKARSQASKSAAQKSTLRKPSVTKAAFPSIAAGQNSPGRRYSPAAGEKVREELHAMHQGKLKIGKSDKKVTNPRQAIAIGLAEARREGKKSAAKPERI